MEIWVFFSEHSVVTFSGETDYYLPHACHDIYSINNDLLINLL